VLVISWLSYFGFVGDAAGEEVNSTLLCEIFTVVMFVAAQALESSLL